MPSSSLCGPEGIACSLAAPVLGWPLGYLNIFPYRFHKDSQTPNIFQMAPKANQDCFAR